VTIDDQDIWLRTVSLIDSGPVQRSPQLSREASRSSCAASRLVRSVPVGQCTSIITSVVESAIGYRFPLLRS
jgi:hypothetical protein